MNRTCNKCGWVHFGVTRHYAETEVQQFNEYFASLSKEEQDDFYGGKKSSIASYEHCFFCWNPYTDFRESKEGDSPVGCTLGPIIYEHAIFASGDATRLSSEVGGIVPRR